MTRYGWGSLGGKNKPPTLMEILNLQGLGSNVLCCLDAGAGDSYPGSGTTWYDLSENNRDVTIPSGVFSGVSDGRSPSEYLSLLPDYGTWTDFVFGSSFSFMDSWHTASANFSVILGFKPGTITNTTLDVLGTGVFVSFNQIAKGFALHRGANRNPPNGFSNFKSNARMYAIYQSAYGDNSNASGVDTGLDLPVNTFAMTMAAIKTGEQHFRVNNSSNNTAASWGGGNSSAQGNFPSRYIGNFFTETGTASAWQISHMAFFDTVLSSSQLSNIYNAYKSYRDPSLP